MDDLNDKNLVVKSNRLVEASYRLTTQEQRIILVMASMVKPEDVDFQRYKISIKNFIELVGIKDQSKYPETKKITKKLLEKTLVIKSGQSELQIGWLSSAEYFDGKGFVELEFSPKLKPYLLHLQEFFTQYQLKNVVRLKRSYSIRIYELLKQYEQLKERAFELEELKRILGVIPGEYKNYADFKRRVLLPSQKDLKRNTDIRFDFKEKKQGRKVAIIIFYIRQNLKKAKVKDEKPAVIEVVNPELYDRLRSYFCLSESQAREVLAKYEEDQIRQNLAYVEAKQKKGLIDSIGPYTLKAIHEDYRQQMSLFEVAEKEKMAQAEKEEAEKQLISRQNEKFDSYRRKEVEKFKKSLGEAKIKALEGKVRKKIIAKHGARSLGLSKLIEIEVIRNLAKMAGLPSREEWIADKKFE